VVTKIANPDKTGVNTSATVAKMVKGAGQYAGSKIKWHLQLTFQLRVIKIKVWSPVAGKKFVKEGAAKVNQPMLMWQELSFDFTG
jgi:hypothetical protein